MIGRSVPHPSTGAWACSAAFLVLQLGWGPLYPVFRDEFYCLACAGHLAWGYVDHPPLSIVVLAAWRFLIGDSLLSLRVLPSLAGATTVLLTSVLACLAADGFRRRSQHVAVLGAPTVFGITSFYSMNAFDFMFWLVAILLLDASAVPTKRRALGSGCTWASSWASACSTSSA